MQHQISRTVRAGLIVFLCSVGLGLLSSAPTMAQFSTPFVGDNDQPIGISADGDIEWNRTGKYYIARGNAQASQGDVFIQANVLQAFYRDDGSTPQPQAAPGEGGLSSLGGGTAIFKLVAEGDVYAKSGEDILSGSRLEYFIEQERAVITGDLIILATPQGSVSAKRQIIYDGKQLFAVAEGDAQVVQKNNIVGADRITAYFFAEEQKKKNTQNTGGNAAAAIPGLNLGSGGSGRLRLIEASGGVEVTDGKTYAVAKNARYDPVGQMAILTCAVRLTQGSNQLNGDYIEYNFGTGEARVQSRQVAGCGEGRKRIEILIDPRTGQQISN